MKTLKIFSVAALIGIAAIAIAAFVRGGSIKRINSDNAKGFAVVELFTSEGCSSCPPADELVSKIERETGGKDVYILAFHVDYWNRLGWKDQFSSADYSGRQRRYAQYLHLQGVYTPQIVVNGSTEFVGSEEGKLRKAILTNLQKPAATILELNVTAVNSKEVRLKYVAGRTDKNTVLEVAVLEKAATSKVESGENGGRTLAHVQIVRKLQQVTLNSNNTSVDIALPDGFNAENYEIIAFLQNTVTGVISAAAKTPVIAETAASQ